jgi:hypothetical protein
MCDGEGYCVACLEAGDCSGSVLECKSCIDFRCVYPGLEKALSQQIPGNCRREVCSGDGGLAYELDDGDVPSDGNPCTDGVCLSGVGSQVASPDGKPCGAGLVCDGYESCVTCDPGYYPCCLGNGTIAPRVTEATLAASTPCDTIELDDATYLCRVETAGEDPVEGEEVCGGTVWAYRHQAFCDGASGACTGSLTYWKGEAYTDACPANQLCAVTGTYTECQWCEVKYACEDEYAVTYTPAADACPAGAKACAYDRTAVFCGPNNCDESRGECIEPCDESSSCMSGYECQGDEIALASRTCVLGVCQETRHFLGTCPGGCDLGECQPLTCHSDTCTTSFECSPDGTKILMNRGECFTGSCFTLPTEVADCLTACVDEMNGPVCVPGCNPGEPCCSLSREILGSDTMCENQRTEYACDGAPGGRCGGTPQSRPEVRWCPGDRGQCTGPLVANADHPYLWQDLAAACGSGLCYASEEEVTCQDCSQSTCATRDGRDRCDDCTAGACCDAITGTKLPAVTTPANAVPCDDVVGLVEMECVGGCGGQIRRRELRHFCGGTALCDAPLFTAWQVVQTCDVDSVCVESEGDARCESCTGTGVPEQRPHCNVDGSQVIYPDATTGVCDLDQNRCVYPDAETRSCGEFGCTGAWCNPDPAMACDGQPGVDGDSCDDGDPCTDNDHCAGELCIGQAKRCDTLPCPETDCGFYAPLRETMEYVQQGDTYNTLKNHVAIYLEPPADPGDTSQVHEVVLLGRTIAAEMGGEIDGQIPTSGYFDIAVTAPDQPSLDALIQVWSTDVRLRRIEPVPLFETTMPKCLPKDDNFVDRPNRLNCVWPDMSFHQGLALFRKLKDELPKLGRAAQSDRIRVLVIDSGFYEVKNFFDPGTASARVDWVSGDKAYFAEEDNRIYARHGTPVTALIAAMKDGAPLVGAARSYLGEDLRILAAHQAPTGGLGPGDLTAAFLANAIRAGARRAKVVNISAALPARRVNADSYRVIRDEIRAFPNTLFVVSMPNDRREVSEGGALPASLKEDNVLPVVGTAECDPRYLWGSSNIWDPKGSAYWNPNDSSPPIIVAAPAAGVPLIATWNGLETGSYDLSTEAPPVGQEYRAAGNSYATPLVTSLATIVRWMNPSLTPRQVKDLLNAEPGGAPGLPMSTYQFAKDRFDLSNEVPVIDFARAIGLTALNMAGGQGAAPWLDRYIARPESDFEDNQEPDQTGQVMSRVTGCRTFLDVPLEHHIGFHLDIDQQLNSQQEVNDAYLRYLADEQPRSFSLIAVQLSGEAGLALECMAPCPLQMNIPYAISSAPSSGAVLLTYASQQRYYGRGTSGEIKFTDCEIVDRIPVEEPVRAPKLLIVEGELTPTTLIVSDVGADPIPEPTDDSILYGRFRLLVYVEPGGLAEDYEHLETMCRGGRVRALP